ncbi:MAG TPA: aminotransferase class I/II-fold pyridoxal phosphate-dependent enzyme [Deltaproteobacteria bacterium]|nr:aminotransferase class I/II-fold pyridoxal phosphate-dependent enzyme [Deltaproteobacteria bacterium]
MDKPTQQMETKLIHAGDPEQLICGAVTMPVFQSATFEYSGQGSYHDIRYIRLNNTPNHLLLSEKLAAIENAQSAIVAASGMAAISTTLLALLNAGDHFLAQSCLYGGTHDLITKDLPSLGITVDFIDANAPETWESKLQPRTKIVFMEAVTNPLLQVGDHRAMVAFCKAHGLLSLIDNTFPTPVNFRPIDLGYDISIHSGTKYLNGHSDIVAGAVMGPSHLIRKVTHKLNHLGGTLDPHACFLLDRGLKTLALRMKHHNQSAMEMARFLENHERVEKVNYPGLENHPEHHRAKELFDGFGGMMSFELTGGVEAADAFIHRLTIPISAPSLGGVESLITRPVTTSHAGVSPEDLKKLGISDRLIRLSVGIEATADLIEDFEQALRA